MKTYFIKNEDILRFYDCIAAEYELYVPVKIESKQSVKCEYSFDLPNTDFRAEKYSKVNKQDITFPEYRSLEPARTFFTFAKEKAGDYFNDTSVNVEEKLVAICGFKNCDLFSLRIQDFVFLGGEEPDPIYKKRRESALIISSDCTGFKEVCFCAAFDIMPHVQEGFDFNLSILDDGYLVDVGSPKAEKIKDNLKDILSEATSRQLNLRNVRRDALVKRLKEHLSYHKIPKKGALKEIVTSGHNSSVWQEQMQTCVECGGCVYMCDTCHCFLLADEKTEKNSQRLKVWDGCMHKNFNRVAGGANPLKMRYMRLRNRYIKKFDFFIDNIGYQACCGCGRCIDVCPGKIDIRYILRRLYEEKYLPAS